MARKLRTYVHVVVDGESRTYGPEDTVPADAVKAITNPDVWEDAPEPRDPHVDEAADESTEDTPGSRRTDDVTRRGRTGATGR